MRRLVSLALALALVACQSADPSRIDVRKTGAKGDGHSDDAAAIQKAIDRCSSQGGGTVYLGGGRTYLSGPLELKSNVNLFVDAGTTLLANPDESIYHLSAFGKNEAEGMMWIHCKDVENVTISGMGTIDGNAIPFMGEELFDSYDLKPIDKFDPRPHVMTLVGVKNLSIRDLTIKGAAYWTVHLAGCEDAVISGVNILNSLKVRNCDGIDVDHSRNVRISDCHITSGDDCICLKNRREYSAYGPCTDIVVTNCTMTSRSCAIKIGSENVDSIARVLINNCIISASNRGLGIQNRDEGTVTDVLFENILMECRLWSDVWWGKAEPIYVTSYPRKTADARDASWRFPEGATKGSCGPVSGIRFVNIYAQSENGSFVGADEPGKVTDVTFENVNVTIKSRGTYRNGIIDRRPCEGEEFITGEVKGIYTENVSGLDTSGMKVRIL